MSFYLQGNAATDLREMVILIPISPAFVLNLTVEKKSKIGHIVKIKVVSFFETPYIEITYHSEYVHKVCLSTCSVMHFYLYMLLAFFFLFLFCWCVVAGCCK